MTTDERPDGSMIEVRVVCTNGEVEAWVPLREARVLNGLEVACAIAELNDEGGDVGQLEVGIDQAAGLLGTALKVRAPKAEVQS